MAIVKNGLISPAATPNRNLLKKLPNGGKPESHSAASTKKTNATGILPANPAI